MPLSGCEPQRSPIQRYMQSVGRGNLGHERLLGANDRLAVGVAIDVYLRNVYGPSGWDAVYTRTPLPCGQAQQQ